MLIVLATTVIGLVLGFGAIQELYVPGIQGGQVRPFWVGTTGTVVCLLFMASAVALWQRWKNARSFAIAAALLFIAFHVYASMPPHRNVGIPALLLSCAYGLGFLVFALRHDESPPAI